MPGAGAEEAAGAGKKVVEDAEEGVVVVVGVVVETGADADADEVAVATHPRVLTLHGGSVSDPGSLEYQHPSGVRGTGGPFGPRTV